MGAGAGAGTAAALGSANSLKKGDSSKKAKGNKDIHPELSDITFLGTGKVHEFTAESFQVLVIDTIDNIDI
jgi:hypothetical protein